MNKGTGYIDVTVQVLPMVLGLLPSPFRIIGSRNADNEIVRLMVESEEIVGDFHDLRCTVSDKGTTRTVEIVLPPEARKPA